jgi:hypothetical protein
MTTKKQNKVTTLPTSLIQHLESLNLSKANLAHALRFIDYLINRSYKKTGNYSSFVSVPSAYLLKVYGGKYNEWMKPIVESSIILTTTYSYGGAKAFCRTYSINNDFFIDGELATVTYQTKIIEKTLEQRKVKDYVVEDLKELILDTDKMKFIADSKMSDLSIKNFRINEQVLEDSFEVIIKDGNYTSQPFFIKREDALNKAQERGRTLIQDKRRFFIMNADEFIVMKKNVYNLYYTDCISKLSKGIWLANRNDTNRRLDTNLTNLCKDLTNIIVEDNNLVQLDLSNSQFAILSHLIPTEVVGDDVELFKELSYSGKLYDYIKGVLALENKKEAKQVTFELLFSSNNNKSSKLKKLKEVFPNVLGWINGYKKENGTEAFAVMLQMFESEMFIDHLWMDIKRKGYMCLTKHDSLIVKREDYEFVKEYIQVYFDSIGFKGIISCDEVNKSVQLELQFNQ